MRALISTTEKITNIDGTTGFRVAQVSEEYVEVCRELVWVECSENVVADQYYYDEELDRIMPMPMPPTPTQPISTGTQTF